MQLLLHSEIFLNNLENKIGEIKEQYKSISYKEFNGVTIREGLYFVLDKTLIIDISL